MPHDLGTTQSFLVAAVQKESPIAADQALATVAVELVTGNDRLSPTEQVDIYRRQYWLRHRALLRADYPGLTYVLGDAAMDAFCRAYLDAHPPRAGLLVSLDADLPAFAERYQGYAEGRAVLAADMARYEHTLGSLLHLAGAPPLDPQKLASLPEDAWEHARFVLHPVLARLRLSYPVHRLRQAIKAGTSPPLPETPSPAFVVLYRHEFVNHFEELSAEALALLDLLAAGEPLVAACDRVAAGLSPEAQEALGANVGAWFQTWTARGWIADVVVEPSAPAERSS